MNQDIIFLNVDDVLVIQADTIHQEGGLAGLRDRALLEAAVMMPQQMFGGQYLHPTLPCMAAAYLFHVAGNHPFHDGNKRAAAMAALVFLDVNGVQELPDPVEMERITLGVATGRIGKEELSTWFTAVCMGDGDPKR